MKIELEAVAFVRGGRSQASDDDWGKVQAKIELEPQFSAEAMAGLEQFSHLVVVYYFHQADPAKVELAARHPRNNPDWPKVGIFAQRGKNRPNWLAVSHCQLLGIENRILRVQGLDAIDGTPVLDIKPYMSGFAPQGEVREPGWAREIMANYW